MEKETTLATTGLTQADFGKLLVENAQERQKAKFVKEAAEIVQRLLSGIDTIKRCMGRDKYMLEIYESRVQAIKDGKFKMTTTYQHNTQTIVYDEERLNENC